MTNSPEIVYGTTGTGMTYAALEPLMRELARKPRTISPLLRALLARQESPEPVEYGVWLLDDRAEELFHLLGESSRGMSLEPHFAALKRTSRLQGHLSGLVQKRGRP